MHDLHVTTGATLPLLGWASTDRLNPHRVLPLRADECYPGKPGRRAVGLAAGTDRNRHRLDAVVREAAP